MKRTEPEKLDYAPVFYSDIYEEGLLYAVLVRSPISNGTIRAISHPALPPDYSLFTAAHIPGKNCIKTFDTEFPVFAHEHISYEGEPVGILIGPDNNKLQQLLTELDISFTRAFSAQKRAAKTEDTDILARCQVRHGDFETIWQTAATKLDKTYKLHLELPAAAETNGAVCQYSEEKLTVHTPTRWQSHLRENLRSVLACKSDQILLRKTILPQQKINSPWNNTSLAVQCALASFLTKKNVLLTLSRSEQSSYIECGLPITVSHKTAIDDSGLITAAAIDVSVNAGAFNPFISPLCERLCVTAINAYKPQNLKIDVCATRSQMPPGMPIMQWADYHVFFAIENQMQEIARLTGLNPADIRRKNIFLPEEENTFPLQLEMNVVEAALQSVLKKSDFYRKYACYNFASINAPAISAPVPIRGIGLSTAYEGNGFFASKMNLNRQSLQVSMETDGSVIIYAYASSTTIEGIWKKLAAEMLSVSVDAVHLSNKLKKEEESDLPENMLGNISVMTQLLKKCCAAIQKLRFRQPLPIKVKRTLSAASKNNWNQEQFSGTPYYTTSWAAAVAEIELNPHTFTYNVRGIWISIDGGTILHDARAELVMHQCVRQVLSSSEKFQSTPPPPVSISFIQSNNEPKQIGELIFNVLPAALTAAVSQAIKTQIQVFPAKTDIIYKTIQELKQGEKHAPAAENKQ